MNRRDARLALQIVLAGAAGLFGSSSFGVEARSLRIPFESGTPDPARVYSCAIDFPLNSVSFDEDAVHRCFAGIELKRVSYVHVIATATPLGKTETNLYLSTRRAGAIEAFIKNRYAGISVHAFGGGENPRFGKVARIFIVENPSDGPAKGDGRLLAMNRGPLPKPLPPTIITKVVAPPKAGLSVDIAAGGSRYQGDDAAYSFHSLSVLKEWPKDRRLRMGMRYGIHRSNADLDIQLVHGLISRREEWHPMAGSTLSAEALVFAGAGLSAGSAADGGAELRLGLAKGDLETSVQAGYGRIFRWVGIAFGMVL